MKEEFTWATHDMEWRKQNPGKPYMYKVFGGGATTKHKHPTLKKVIIPRAEPIKIYTGDASNAGIYVIVCEPEKTAYIGLSANMQVRLRNHRMEIISRTSKNKAYLKFREHYAIYGIEGFDFKAYSNMPDATNEELLEAENNTMVEFINKGYTLYNQSVNIRAAKNAVFCPSDIVDVITRLVAMFKKDAAVKEKMLALMD